MGPFRKLLVWQKAHQLTLSIYRVTRTFPEDERYGLTSQMRRSAASIGANLAEGSARRSDKDFARFVQIAFGSATEIEQHLILAKDLGYLSEEDYATLDGQVVDVKRMLTGLGRSLRVSARNGRQMQRADSRADG